MPYYSAPYTFDFESARVVVDPGGADIDCAVLYDAVKKAQASEEGILYERIAAGSGLVSLGGDVSVGLTVELLGSWQLQFASGNYVARVGGGNLVGGPSGDPIAYTPGVQVLLIQSAAATVIEVSGGGGSSAPTAAEVATAVWNKPVAAHQLPGTFGKFVSGLLSVARYLGLK